MDGILHASLTTYDDGLASCYFYQAMLHLFAAISYFGHGAGRRIIVILVAFERSALILDE